MTHASIDTLLFIILDYVLIRNIDFEISRHLQKQESFPVVYKEPRKQNKMMQYASNLLRTMLGRV
jgi:hypothetical protein